MVCRPFREVWLRLALIQGCLAIRTQPKKPKSIKEKSRTCLMQSNELMTIKCSSDSV